MKTKKTYIFLVLLLGVLMSCNSYDDPTLNQNEFLGNPTFETSINQIDQDLNALDTDIVVTTNTKWWTIKSDAAWATVPTDTLYGNATVKLQLAENETTDKRVATLTLQSGTIGPKKTIAITQTGLPSYVSLSETQILAGGYGGTFEVDVTSNASWTVKVNNKTQGVFNWISVSPMSGQGNGKITITVVKNTSETIGQLQATIAVSVSDETKELEVEQIGNANCDAPNNTEKIYFDQFFPCDDAPVGSTWTLVDPRDEKEYRVRLMADGNIWMVDDLKFAGDKGNEKANLNTFDGNGTQTLGSHIPNYWGDVTNFRLYGYIPADRGYIYGWQTIMQDEYARNAGGYSTNMVREPEYQGIAPTGWQVPSIEQYEKLYEKIGYQGFVNDWDVVFGGNIGFNTTSNWGVNVYAQYWTITQKNRDKSKPGGSEMNTILKWQIHSGTSTAERVDSPRNYGSVVRLLKMRKK